MGYTVEGKQHWNMAQETKKQIPTENLFVWCADANGKLRNRDRTDHMINKIIGMDTISGTTEPGNGKRIQDICARRDLIPMTTWRRQPRQTKHGPEGISTWAHPGGNVKRQIDCISINQKYRT